jgi:hypothetical protein
MHTERPIMGYYDSIGSRYGDCHGCVDRPWLSGGFCMVLEAKANANAKRNEVGNPAVFICTLAAAGSFVLREILYSAVRRTQRGALRGPRA